MQSDSSLPIVYVPMVADYIHHGHINILNEAKKYGKIIVGLMTDSAAASYKKLPLLTFDERKFIKIDPDNFNEVMKKVEPGVQIRVQNTLSNKDEELAVSLKFNSMSDFEPAQIVEQVPALKELKTARDQLRDLLSKTDRSDKLEQLLESVLNDNKKIQALAKELGLKIENKTTD